MLKLHQLSWRKQNEPGIQQYDNEKPNEKQIKPVLAICHRKHCSPEITQCTQCTMAKNINDFTLRKPYYFQKWTMVVWSGYVILILLLFEGFLKGITDPQERKNLWPSVYYSMISFPYTKFPAHTFSSHEILGLYGAHQGLQFKKLQSISNPGIWHLCLNTELISAMQSR